MYAYMQKESKTFKILYLPPFALIWALLTINDKEIISNQKKKKSISDIEIKGKDVV